MDDSSDQEQEPSSPPYDEEEVEDHNEEGSDAEDGDEGSFASANNHEDDEEDGNDGNNEDEGGEDEDEDDEEEGEGEEQEHHDGSEDDDDGNERPDDASYSAEDEMPHADESNGGSDGEGQGNSHGDGHDYGANPFPFPTPTLPALPPPDTTVDYSAVNPASSHNPTDSTVSRNPAYAPVTKPLPLGVTIHATPPRLQGKHHCRVVGCPKLLQTNNDGFCRAHFNMYSSKAAFGGNLGAGIGGDVDLEGAEFWVCKCGQRISNKQVRCGTCFKWKGGKREPFALKGEGDDGKKKKKKKKKKKDKSGGSAIEGDKAVKAGKKKKIKTEEVVLTDWTCECGEYLTAKKKRCGKCNRWRGGKRNTSIVIKRKKKNSSTFKKEDNGEPWKCDCGEMVSSLKARCGKCRHWKGGKKNSKSRMESHDMAREVKMEAQQLDPETQEDWACVCGEVIKGTKSRCGKCHHWRGGKRVVKNSTTPRKRKSEGPKNSASDPFEHENVDWRCSKCDTLMGAKKKRCSECMAWRYKRKKTKTGYTSESAVPELESTQENFLVQPLAHLPQSQLADITDTKMPVKPKNSINGNLNSLNMLNSVNALNTQSNLTQTNQESLTTNTINPISSELASAASALGINVGPNVSGSVNTSFYENTLHNYAGAGLRGNGNFASQFNPNHLSHNRFNLNQSNFNADHIFGRNSNDHSSPPYGLNTAANSTMNHTMSSMNHSMLGTNMQSRINMQNRNVMGGRTNMTSQSFNNPTSNSPSATMNNFSMSANTRSTLNSLFNNSSNLGGMGGMRGNNSWGDDRLMFNNHFDGMGGGGSNSNNFNINNSFPTGGNFDFPDSHGVMNHNGEVNRDDSPFIQI